MFIKIESLLVQFLETICEYPLRDAYDVPTVSYFNKGEESEEIIFSEDDDIEEETLTPNYLVLFYLFFLKFIFSKTRKNCVQIFWKNYNSKHIIIMNMELNDLLSTLKQ